MNHLTVFLSNRIEHLYQGLKSALFVSPNTFVQRIIVVSSPAIKSWLTLRMANDPEVAIAMGFQVSYLDQTMHQLSQTFSSHLSSHHPTKLEIALAIESEIHELSQRWNSLSHLEQNIWDPLFHYLKISSASPTRKSQKRLVALADKLSKLFHQYGLYGGAMLSEWEQLNPESIQKHTHGWQIHLWQQLYRKYPWSYPCKTFMQFNWKPQVPLQLPEIHLFSISFLPKVYHNFLTALSENIPINYFVLSPCQLFWSDILSDRESQFLQKQWKKRHASQEQLQNLNEYLIDRNPLLANLGKLGREMACQIEENNSQIFSNYSLPSSCDDQKYYQHILNDEISLENKNAPLSCLEALQADIMLLRNPDRNSKIELASKDQSIQIHMAYSRAREVEVIHDIILHHIHKHSETSNPLFPEDFLVMAPNIMEYEPFIRAKFEKEQTLDFQVMDLKMGSQNQLVQGFLHLISLPFGRWDALSLLKLFNHSCFQKQHGFTSEDIFQIRLWIKEAGILWGNDASHRDELLKQDHCLEKMAEETGGTWDEGFSRLIAGLVMNVGANEQEGIDFPIFPIQSIDPSQCELLGKWISILDSLKEDLNPLTDGTEFSLKEWSLYLKCLLNGYFDMSAEGNNLNGGGAASLIDQIDLFQQAAKSMSDAKFTFITIRKHLEAGLNQESLCFRETHLHAIRFCSMLPLRAIPAKMIILMGMHEGAFPRREQPSSLNLLNSNPNHDYCPSQTDYDRFLFLEALLSAREYLVISYQGFSSADHTDLQPSLLVTELIQYLDKACRFGTSKPSDCIIHHHPFDAFDHRYFNPESPLQTPGYSKTNYQEALAYYHLEKSPPHRFFPDFGIKILDTYPTAPLKIELKQLISFAQNPLKSYFNKTLGIYIREEEKIETDEKFTLSPIELSSFKKSGLNAPLDTIINLASKQRKLPSGPFKILAKNKIKDEVDSLKKNLSDVDISSKDVFSLSFDEHNESPYQDANGNWELPPLQIEYRNQTKVMIIGKFLSASSKGLLVHLKDDKVDALKAWPQFLIFNCLISQYSLPFNKELIFLKSGKSKSAFFEDPFLLLEHYLDYYFASLENASPLIPEWTFDFLHTDTSFFSQRLKTSLDDDFNPLYNEYVHWICQGSSLPDSDELMSHWKNHANRLFTEIFKHWYPSKTKRLDEVSNEKL